MRVLFTAVRYHPNQRFAVESLLQAGHEVSFMILTGEPGYEELTAEERVENYEPGVLTSLGFSAAFKPFALLARRLFDRDVERRYDFPGYERFKSQWGFPPIVRFWRALQAFDPDVTVVRNPSGGFGLLAILYSNLLGAQVLFYTQGAKYRRLSTPARLYRGLAARLAAARWITPVLGEPERHPSTLDRLYYIPFVVPARTAPDDRQWFRKGAINVISVARFYPRKNHRLFLKAIDRLQDRDALRATIVGKCTTENERRELERVRGCIDELGIGDSVEIKLNLPTEQVQREYARHDLFVLASREEPAAVSPLEAMAHSLPVICSDNNGTRCYIEEGVNGFVFRTDCLEDLVLKIGRAIDPRSRVVEMGRESFRIVQENHRPEIYERKLMAVVNAGR